MTPPPRSARHLEREWGALCAEYLPVSSTESFWRMSRLPGRQDPAQGWKLHVSATVLTASQVLGVVAPELRAAGVLFKAPSSLVEVGRINCGLFYGVSQIGKVLTVYPRAPEEARRLAAVLDALTHGTSAPDIPYERRYGPASAVFYRYGAFDRVQTLRGPDGTTVPDTRTDPSFEPYWCPSPFPVRTTPRRPAGEPSPLLTRYLAYDSLMQRGKGGVYKALDMSETPFRVRVIKEGRRHGETDWGGRDGSELVRTEARALAELRRHGVDVPRLRDTFVDSGNTYVVLDHVGDRNLEGLLREARTLPIDRAVRWSARLAAIVADIHDAGWAWRDVKPRNVVVDGADELHPIDFEGACRLDSADDPPWGSEGYLPPEWPDPAADQAKADLFALGVTCYQLLAGSRFLDPDLTRYPKVPIGTRRRGIPREIRQLVAALLDPEPAHRPSARTAAQSLAETANARPPSAAALLDPEPAHRPSARTAAQSLAEAANARPSSDRLADR